MSQTDFEGRKGILYYSFAKPSEPYGISDGIFIVPSGWQMVPLPQSIGSLAMCRAHFVTQSDWSEKIAWDRFRDWVIFDSFVLNSPLASILFDNNIFVLDRVTYSVHQGSKGDPGDRRGEFNYDNVTYLLVEDLHRSDNLQSVTYAELYSRFRNIPAKTKSRIEWFVSPPPSSHSNICRNDAFFGNYWPLLHITVLIESIIGLPPYCEHQFGECKICGKSPPRHYEYSRRDWLREALKARLADTNRVEEYATLIETAYKIRNPMSHGPLFDRSSFPTMTHGQTEVYDMDRAVKEFKLDSIALSAILSNLRKIAHAFLVDEAFGIKRFAPISDLKVFTIRGSF